MRIAENRKDEIISDVLKAIYFTPRHTGYSSIHFVLLKAWIDENDDWTTYEEYISKIASDREISEKVIISQMNKSIGAVWRRYYGRYKITKCLFGYDCEHESVPSWTLLMRTILSVLFYCEKNDIDVMTLLTELSCIEPQTDNDYEKYLAGYLITLLKKMGLPDLVVDKTPVYFADIVKNISFGEAFITYIKHTSIFFAVVAFDGIIIPPELFNTSVFDLHYENHRTKVRLGNLLIRNGICSLKDLRYKSIDDIKEIRNFGEKAFESLVKALKRTINTEACE